MAVRAFHTFKQRSGWFAVRHRACNWSNVPLPANPDWARSWRDRFLPSTRSPSVARWKSGKHAALTEAEKILSGTFPLFGHLDYSAGVVPDWFTNPLTGRRATADAHWSTLREFADGDIKGVWELSRFGFVFPLARAYAHTADERFALAFWRLVENWVAANLPAMGPQWKCGQETAIRVIAISVAVAVFLDSPESTPGRLELLGRVFAESERRIEVGLSYGLNQDNNHGLSELAGLISVALAIYEPAEALRRVRHWARLFEREILRLVAPDGAFSQYSTNYHRMLLYLAGWCGGLLERAKCPLRSEARSRIGSAALLAAQMMDWDSGQVPCYGCNDGADILPMSNGDYLDHRSAVQLAFLWARHERLLPSGPWDETAWWVLGDWILGAPQAQKPLGDLAAGSCGYYSLNRGGTMVFVRCGEHAFRPHHADQLHVEVRRRGTVIAADAGTFSYNALPPHDHAFALTAFHNTVSVDDRDQMDRVGRFLWLPWSRGRLLVNQTNCDGSRFWAGTFQWPRGIVHQRSIHLGSDGDVTILDKLEASDEHRYTLHWLLNDLPVASLESPQLLRFRLPDDSYCVLTIACSEFAMEADRIRADRASGRGWMSRYYQRLEPAWSWRVSCVTKRCAFVTHMAASPAEIRFDSERVEVDEVRYDWSNPNTPILGVATVEACTS
jgi:hypothetical protein